VQQTPQTKVTRKTEKKKGRISIRGEGKGALKKQMMATGISMAEKRPRGGDKRATWFRGGGERLGGLCPRRERFSSTQEGFPEEGKMDIRKKKRKNCEIGEAWVTWEEGKKKNPGDKGGKGGNESAIRLCTKSNSKTNHKVGHRTIRPLNNNSEKQHNGWRGERKSCQVLDGNRQDGVQNKGVGG